MYDIKEEIQLATLDLQELTLAMIGVQSAVEEATVIFTEFAEMVHEWRMKEIAILCALLSERQSRMMRN